MQTVHQAADFYSAAERRIGLLTLVLGLAAAAVVAVVLSLSAGVGVAVGALLAWVNYIWLKQATHALTRVATAQAAASKPKVSPWVYVRFFGRYALIGVVLYVMVTQFAIPVASLLGGLLALGGAAMTEGIYENLR